MEALKDTSLELEILKYDTIRSTFNKRSIFILYIF